MTTTIDTETRDKVAATLKTIVFVENESVDYLIARGQLAKLGVRNPIHRTTTVSAMLDYVKQALRVQRLDPGASPCVIMMELKLPQRSGLDGLAALRASPEMRGIPVIAMGGADRVQTLKSAVEAGASAYLIKPFQSEAFNNIVQELDLPLQFAPQPKKLERQKPAPTPRETVQEKPVAAGLLAFAKGLRIF
jgi:CheY-like chemotaxis protein